MSPLDQPQWHSLSAEDCLTNLKVSTEGLTTAQASERREQSGPNRLELAAGRSSLAILWDQFSNVMLLMLCSCRQPINTGTPIIAALWSKSRDKNRWHVDQCVQR